MNQLNMNLYHKDKAFDYDKYGDIICCDSYASSNIIRNRMFETIMTIPWMIFNEYGWRLF